ncbi:hypothetical protein RRG08_051417 [Elysia crispata]|uniref:Uncharacterized protein n=1 Tax=Elysia crispata TaxID=231223 RepID=A0AAE1E9T6_9GAST|nr:hypothetical protein RRG08_051417 [Elysia crispata]
MDSANISFATLQFTPESSHDNPMHTSLFPRQSYLHCAFYPQEKLVFEQILHKLSSLFTELDLGLVFAHLCPTNFLHQNHRLQLNTNKLLFYRGLVTSRILHQKQTLYTGPQHHFISPIFAPGLPEASQTSSYCNNVALQLHKWLFDAQSYVKNLLIIPAAAPHLLLTLSGSPGMARPSSTAEGCGHAVIIVMYWHPAVGKFHFVTPQGDGYLYVSNGTNIMRMHKHGRQADTVYYQDGPVPDNHCWTDHATGGHAVKHSWVIGCNGSNGFKDVSASREPFLR